MEVDEEKPINERICGEPRGDGCGKPIGNRPYAVRYDPELKKNIIYHVECESKLPPIHEWTAISKKVASLVVAEQLISKVFEEIVNEAFNKHGNEVKQKNANLIKKYGITDNDIKEAMKVLLRRKQ